MFRESTRPGRFPKPFLKGKGQNSASEIKMRDAQAPLRHVPGVINPGDGGSRGKWNFLVLPDIDKVEQAE